MLLILFGEPVFSRMNGIDKDLRWCAWSITSSAILDNFWLGTGFGTFIDSFPTYRDPICLGTEGTWHRAHNSFLELILGLGLAALVFLLLGYQIVLRCCFLGLKYRKSLRAIPILTLGILVFVSGHSLVDFPMQIPGVATYCAALLGAGCAISITQKTKGRRRPRKMVTRPEEHSDTPNVTGPPLE